MPSTKSGRPPAWEVHLSTEARDWLISCTTDQAALARVMSSFSFIFQKLDVAGPRVGEPDIKKLIATQGMWEARVKDRPAHIGCSSGSARSETGGSPRSHTDARRASKACR